MKNPTILFRVPLLFLLLFNYGSALCQPIEKPVKKVYLDLAAGATSDNGAFWGLGLQGILKHNWVASVSYQELDINPKNLPSDYNPGHGWDFSYLFPIPTSEKTPNERMNIINFTGGKRFASGRKTWFTTEAGLSIISGQEFAFEKRPITREGLWESSNYSYTTEDKTTLGGILKADFNWAFSPYVGLGAGAFVNFSSLQTPVGGHIKLIAGWLNTKKKKES